MSKKIYITTLITTIIILLIFLTRSIFLQNYENSIPIFTTILTFLLPFIIEKIFKIKNPYSIKTFYVIYMFISKYLGGDNCYFSTIPMYDKIVHSIYGIFSYFISIFIIVKFTKIKTINTYIIIIFCITFVLGTSVIWEFLEFFADSLTSGNNQRLETGINDTMLDLIFTFLTSCILSIINFIEIKVNKNILIHRFIRMESSYEKNKTIKLDNNY